MSPADRTFFVGLSLVAAALMFAGFAPTYFLKAWYGTPALPAFVHLHGLLMTAWFVLLIGQTSLVATGRIRLHRRLGIAGAVIAGLIAISTIDAAIRSLPTFSGIPGFGPSIVVVSFSSVAQFVGFAGVALWLRRKPDAHKRLMFLATTVLLTASVGRWPIIRASGGPPSLIAFAVCAVSDLLVVAMIVHDRRTRGRVHPSLVWGGLALVVAQCLQEAVRHTAAAHAFAAWLLG